MPRPIAGPPIIGIGPREDLCFGQTRKILEVAHPPAISQQSQTLYEISTQPNAPVTGNVVLASPPVGLAVADSSVWVATADGSLTQIGF